MDQNLQQSKRILRAFLQAQYSDQNLAQALDHARSGQLAFCSCCCFVGIVTANHPLKGVLSLGEFTDAGHLFRARQLPRAYAAEQAYSYLSSVGSRDAVRRTRLIPMILAEIKRRKHTSMDGRYGAGSYRRLQSGGPDVSVETTPVVESESCPVL